jgi:glutaconyl-CoA/methylmalonyl-CoA decarboxylase subunit gamma
MERLRITVDGKSYEVVVEKIDDGSAEVAPPPVRSAAPAARAAAPAPAAPPKPAAPAAAGDMTSPLAGIVQAIEVTVGAQVKEGDLVITLEAMKMYTPINATASGTIKAIHVKTGDAVEEGQPLFTIG